MKRTLLEVSCGLGALVLMGSLHHQIARLEGQQKDVSNLERKVDQAVAAAGESRDLQDLRQQILAQTEARIQALELQLKTAASGSTVQKDLEDDLQRAKV